MGKVESADLSLLYQPGERRKWFAELRFRVRSLVVALLRRAEDFFHFRVVVEQGKKDGNAFDNGGAELGLDAFPILIEPSLYGFKLREFVGIGVGGVLNAPWFERNALGPQ